MVNIGLDIGSVTLKMAALGGAEDARLFEELRTANSAFSSLPEALARRATGPVVVTESRRICGNPLQCVLELLQEFYAVVPETRVEGVRVAGSAARLIAQALGARRENEFKAIARAVGAFYPEVRTVFEMGGESSKYLLLDPARDGQLGIVDYSTNGECAAGTGSFLDQQASRLQYRVEDIAPAAACAGCTARIAGRCSVFAKSDMIHAQQKGYATPEILKGLCEAVARNFKSSIVKGKPVIPPVAFLGGVAQNTAVRDAMGQLFRLPEGQPFVPELFAWMGALGAALFEQQERKKVAPRSLREVRELPPEKSGGAMAPLSMENVLSLRERVQPYSPPTGNGRLRAYLGIDVGSVSTNFALLDDEGRLLHEIYLRTVGRPIEIVHQGLQEIAGIFADRLEIAGVGTTGSGRELIGELVGADCINDEITAHKTGAMFISTTMVGEPVDTIFEIGGQDSKFISVENGVVVDFAMNEACAAGTGSFLEEQAEQLGVRIEGDFARLALAARAPARLGERCTVFMERDVTAWMRHGADKSDLCAGLAYSVALNYLNRVVRGRRIARVIYFQGGTAYNDAVAAAFSHLLGQRIIVPPYNGVMGAIGEALIARDWARRAAQPSRFRGFDLDRARFQTREFVCKACSNYCDMREITVEGEKTYWGDKCSDKFRKPARAARKPVIDDLVAFRERALLDGYTEPRGHRPRVGVPQAMYFYDYFPFWNRYLAELGFDVVLSGPTDHVVAAQGVELSVAEPCFPIQIAHGHVKKLLDAGVDYVLLPNVMDMGSPEAEHAWHLCPWNQTLPFVLCAAPQLSFGSDRFLMPTLHFQLGPAHVRGALRDFFARLGVGRRVSDAAVDAAWAAQEQFQQRLLEAGRKALAALERTGEPAVILVGRPYNLYDRNVNCDIPRKLRSLYGVNVLPLDFLPLDDQPAEKIAENIYWFSGRRILAAGQFSHLHDAMHLIYITNFKCGPDSFIKHYMREAAASPFLALQFDGHGNDAGYLTRCEAYLDSKGVLRCQGAAPNA